MTGPGYDECGIKYTQRLTYGGEYLHSAPWNVYNITHGVDSSNGCTNLLPTDAQKLYGMLEIGDVVLYPDANGGKMQIGAGLRRLERAVVAVADRRRRLHPLTPPLFRVWGRF